MMPDRFDCGVRGEEYKEQVYSITLYRYNHVKALATATVSFMYFVFICVFKTKIHDALLFSL